MSFKPAAPPSTIVLGHHISRKKAQKKDGIATNYTE